MQTVEENVATEIVESRKQRSYFKSQSTAYRFFLDDGESFIEHKALDEGLFQSFQDINSKIKFDRTGDTTEVDIKVGAQRQFLLDNLVTGWNLVDEKGPVVFSKQRLLELDPSVISKLLEDIYAKNEILRPEEPGEEVSEPKKSG